MSQANALAIQPTARRHPLSTCGRSVSFNARIQVLTIPARPHASDDAAQHTPAKPTMTRRNTWSVTWDSQIEVRINPARQSAPPQGYLAQRDDTIPARERDFERRLEAAEKSIQELLDMKNQCGGSNDLDLRLESAEHNSASEDDATSRLSSWLSAESAQSPTSDKPKRHTVMQPKWGGPSL